MPHLFSAARRSDPEFEWDDFATGDFESGDDPHACGRSVASAVCGVLPPSANTAPGVGGSA